MSRTLLLADLHLTSTPRDEYRWRLFPWLHKQIVNLGVDQLVILGDLTESKDHHSAHLVNRLVSELTTLVKAKANGKTAIHLLRGNHDGIDPACPYFRFLREVPGLWYYDTPFLGPLDGRQVLFLPHSRNPLQDWDARMMAEAEVVFMHATVSGARSETGIALDGLDQKALGTIKRATIWSGDVHVQQRVGYVEYVGAPYPIRFGDIFTPRAVMLDGLRSPRDLAPPRFGRHRVDMNRTGNQSVECSGVVLPGDQIKVRVHLTPSEMTDWEKIKRDVVQVCQEMQVELCGIEVERTEPRRLIKRRSTVNPPTRSPQQILDTWTERQQLSHQITETGQQLLTETQK